MPTPASPTKTTILVLSPDNALLTASSSPSNLPVYASSSPSNLQVYASSSSFTLPLSASSVDTSGSPSNNGVTSREVPQGPPKGDEHGIKKPEIETNEEQVVIQQLGSFMRRESRKGNSEQKIELLEKKISQMITKARRRASQSQEENSPILGEYVVNLADHRTKTFTCSPPRSGSHDHVDERTRIQETIKIQVKRTLRERSKSVFHIVTKPSKGVPEHE